MPRPAGAPAPLSSRPPETGREWPPPQTVREEEAAPTVAEEPVFRLPDDALSVTAPGLVYEAPAEGTLPLPRPTSRPPPLPPPSGVPPAPPSTDPLLGRSGASRVPPGAPNTDPLLARSASNRIPPAPPSSAPADRPSARPGPGSLPPPGPRGSTPPTFGVVAFLGTGSMGLPMAANIARRGFSLHVWNRTRERAASLSPLGAKVKSSPAECVEGARLVITMLTDERGLTDVLTSSTGALHKLAPDALVVDMSTIGQAAAVRVAQLVRDAGARFIDAPVTGSPGAAERGELVALVGGKLNEITRAQPVLLSMCRRILHAGDVGSGQALRVLLAGLAADQLVALTSTLALGEKLGLPRRTILEAFAASPYAAPAFAMRKEKLLAKDFSVETTLETHLRDARLFAELQQEAGLPLAVSRETLRTLEKAVEEGLGADDAFALEKYFKL